MILSVIALTVLFVLVIVFAVFMLRGVRLKAYFDLNNGTFIADAFVFGNVHALKYKLFECGGEFYHQINSKELKKIEIKEKREYKANSVNAEEETNIRQNYSDKGKANFAARTTEIIGIFGSWISDAPSLYFKDIKAYLTIGTGNSMSTSLIATSCATLLGVLALACEEKIKCKKSDIAVYPNFRFKNTVLTLDIATGAGLAKLLFAFLSLRLGLIKKLKRVGQNSD